MYLAMAGLGCSAATSRWPATRCCCPLYWGLMSLAAWKGFCQLFTNPFYWEKTEHGLDMSSPGTTV